MVLGHKKKSWRGQWSGSQTGRY